MGSSEHESEKKSGILRHLSKKLHSSRSSSSSQKANLSNLSVDSDSPYFQSPHGTKSTIEQDLSTKRNEAPNSLLNSNSSRKSNMVQSPILARSQTSRSHHSAAFIEPIGNTTFPSFSQQSNSPNTPLAQRTYVSSSQTPPILIPLSQNDQYNSDSDPESSDEKEILKDADTLSGSESKAMNLVEPNSQAFSLMLNEARDDTPSFRACAEYLDIQFAEMEKWLVNLCDKSAEVVHELDRVKDKVNDVISLFMPSVTHCSILAQDYTTLLFGMYTQAESVYWTNIIAHATRNSNEISQMVENIKTGTLQHYKKSRRKYTEDLREHDRSLQLLLKLPSDAEPAALREISHKTYRTSRRLLKSASKLVLSISDLEGETSVSLLETLTSHFLAPDCGYFPYNQQQIQMTIEFQRLKTAAQTLRASLPGLDAELRRLQQSIVRDFKSDAPPKMLDSYNNVDGSEYVKPNKSGWVNVQLPSGEWRMLWAYLHHGLFGFLGVSESGTAVAESCKFVAKTCEFEIIENSDRKCLFKVKNSDGFTIRVQALGRKDLHQWQSAFTNSNESAASGSDTPGNVSSLSPTSSPTPKPIQPTITQTFNMRPTKSRAQSSASSRPFINNPASGWSARELRPWNQSFAIPGCFGGVIPGSGVVVEKIADLRNDIESDQWLRYDSTLTSTGSLTFGITVPAVKPLPTSVQLESVVANSFFKPEVVLNAISANLWGTNGNHMSNKDERSVIHFDDQFPSYPDSYPRSLISQDMDLRAIVSPLPASKRLQSDEFLLFLLRVTTKLNGNDVPARIFVTSRRLIVYCAWRGIVALQSHSIDSIIDVVAEHGIDHSNLIITLLGDENRTEGSQIPFKLFIDSASLAKRRLDHVLENNRSHSPVGSRELVEALALICFEYSESLKNHEIELQNALQRRSASERRTLNGSEGNKSAARDKELELQQLKNDRNLSFGEWLLQSAVCVSTRDVDATPDELMKGMRYKLAEDTFPIPAEVLFVILFGPKSPVFNGMQSSIFQTECAVGPWYRRGKRIERRIAERFTDTKSKEKRFNYQRVELQQIDLFVVTERRSSWEMPGGYQFYNMLKYVVYETQQGSHLQIWSRTIWKTAPAIGADDNVNQYMKIVTQNFVIKARDSANEVKSLGNAKKLYGEVKATKILSSNAEYDYSRVTHVTRSSFLYAMFRIPFILWCKTGFDFLKSFMLLVVGTSGPLLFIIILLLTSLFGNIVLYKKSSTLYWSAYLDHESSDSLLNNLNLSPAKQTIFTRSIYLKDIDNLISKGSLWQPSTVSNGSNRNSCSARFGHTVQLSNQAIDFGKLYELEPRIKTTMDRINSIRLSYAIRRNEMMTMLRVLNSKEREDLEGEYRQWLIDESAMCTKVRSRLHSLNDTVIDGIKSYCISCLEESQNLF